MSPAESTTMSPGTSSATGTSRGRLAIRRSTPTGDGAPQRSARTFELTIDRRLSAAIRERSS